MVGDLTLPGFYRRTGPPTEDEEKKMDGPELNLHDVCGSFTILVIALMLAIRATPARADVHAFSSVSAHAASTSLTSRDR